MNLNLICVNLSILFRFLDSEVGEVLRDLPDDQDSSSSSNYIM